MFQQDNGIFSGFEVFQGFGAAELTTSANCGDLKQTQVILDELGYHEVGTADGLFGKNTKAALTRFASDHGFGYNGAAPSGQICTALQMAHAAAHPGTAPLTPPATTAQKPMFLNPATLASVANAMAAKKQADAAAAAQTAAANASPLSKAKAWWTGQSTMVKVGLVGGLIVLAGLGVMAATSKPSYTANKARRRRRKSGSPKSGSCRKKGVKGCRCKPPKGYPKRRSQYGIPECYMYPLDTKRRTKSAAQRYGKHKRRYPKRVRADLGRRLDAAKKRFHVGQYR